MVKRVLLWGILLFLLLGGGVVCWLSIDEPPLVEIENNRKLLSEAEQLKAKIYCSRLYAEAKSEYDSVMELWKRENERFILLRNYDSVRCLTIRSTEKAAIAIRKAGELKRDIRLSTQIEIDLLHKKMKSFDKVFVSLPLEKKIISRYSEGKLALNEAEIAFGKGDYNIASIKTREAADLIRTAYKKGQMTLEKYFEKLPEWQEQLRKFIARSEKQNEYMIIVQKIPAVCMLYYKGKKKYSFSVEFGKKWLGDKCYEGDNATPEGLYRVVKCLQGKMTRYYKAFLLDYPNDEDRRRIEKLKKEGSLPRNARPGSLIEIHGKGGQGANWTNGCVALTDEDMSVLFHHAGKGTEVLIIGAASDEILKY